MKTPICALCNKVEVEMENGEPTSSFCNGCYFDVLVFRCHEMWIFEDRLFFPKKLEKSALRFDPPKKQIPHLNLRFRGVNWTPPAWETVCSLKSAEIRRDMAK